MREFFGIGGYQREPEGYLSWQHLTFVTLLMLLMVFFAIWLGRARKNASEKNKNRVLVVAALLIDGLEIVKIILGCVNSSDPMAWLYNLPLFLCSIQLITIPVAAFCRGRLKEAALDFVLIFGILGAVLGTYGAGQNYAAYPVLGFDNMVSGVTHAIAGFCSLYIVFSGMISMKKRNMPITFGILGSFCVIAFAVNRLIDYNYMFLVRGDGTPYDIFYNLVGGHPVLYPLIVVALFLLYIFAFYSVYFYIKRRRSRS
ncbi:MAG: hypothetical protein E7639_04990 [Ruminococcaceae bacterium]|nr:hypothetical protein [Oscillospiraceae bacterium]